jgi:integrase
MTLMSEAGIPPKRAQKILGHADVRTTLAIYTHAMRRRHDDSADKIAEIAGSRSWETIRKQSAL